MQTKTLTLIELAYAFGKTARLGVIIEHITQTRGKLMGVESLGFDSLPGVGDSPNPCHQNMMILLLAGGLVLYLG